MEWGIGALKHELKHLMKRFDSTCPSIANSHANSHANCLLTNILHRQQMDYMMQFYGDEAYEDILGWDGGLWYMSIVTLSLSTMTMAFMTLHQIITF